MTNETMGQLITAALVIAGWYLNHRQSLKNNDEIVEVKGMVNGPLLQSIRETAELAREIADKTGLPSDAARAQQKEQALKDRLASSPPHERK